MIRTVFFSTTALLLAACGEAGTTPAQRVADDVNRGWRIDNTGDVNAFLNCLEADGLSLISAHRGGPQPGFPENAIETMAAVLLDIPTIMEVDVATSSDGVMFLMHDDTLERTTTGSGRAAEKPWSEISQLRLVDNDGKATDYRPPRFADALAWAKDKTILQVDFKRSTRFEDVIDEINRQNAEDRIILIAYTMAAARKLHRLAPDVMISLSLDSQSELNRAVAAGVPADRLIGFTGTEAPRPRLFRVLDDRDVEVIFGTLGGRNSIDRDIAQTGDEERYAEISQAGADIIATDRPLAAHAALSGAGRSAGDGVCGVASSR
ncbi:MAG: glycerophosphodiester phosphodiesterase family protein [Pseudomonadota bacterium]